MREVGAGEDAVAEENHEASEGAGSLLGKARGYGLHHLVRALRVQNGLES